MEEKNSSPSNNNKCNFSHFRLSPLLSSSRISSSFPNAHFTSLLFSSLLCLSSRLFFISFPFFTAVYFLLRNFLMSFQYVQDWVILTYHHETPLLQYKHYQMAGILLNHPCQADIQHAVCLLLYQHPILKIVNL